MSEEKKPFVVSVEQSTEDYAASRAVADQVAAPVLDVMATMPEFRNFKLSRNDACPCGSGKKYKACHMQSIPAAPTRKAAVKQSKPSKKRMGLELQRIAIEQAALAAKPPEGP